MLAAFSPIFVVPAAAVRVIYDGEATGYRRRRGGQLRVRRLSVATSQLRRVRYSRGGDLDRSLGGARIIGEAKVEVPTALHRGQRL